MANGTAGDSSATGAPARDSSLAGTGLELGNVAAKARQGSKTGASEAQ